MTKITALCGFCYVFTILLGRSQISKLYKQPINKHSKHSGDAIMFCEKCGSILRPKEKAGKKILFCSCGFSKSPEGDSAEIKEKVEGAKEIHVMEDIETNPKVKIKCDKCQNDIAYYWTQQTRGADEPETRFFKCTKCNHTWREYA